MLRTPDLFNLTGKTALVTGAGGLLGPKHAEALIECGAYVIMTDHHEERAVEKASMLNDKYGKKVASAKSSTYRNSLLGRPLPQTITDLSLLIIALWNRFNNPGIT